MEINKPQSTSVKEYLYKTLAIKLNIPSSTIEKVIQHSFESSYAAMKKKNSIEISGFGKFLFNVKKAQKRLEDIKKIRSIIQEKLNKDPENPSLIRKMEMSNTGITKLEDKLNVSKSE